MYKFDNENYFQMVKNEFIIRMKTTTDGAPLGCYAINFQDRLQIDLRPCFLASVQVLDLWKIMYLHFFKVIFSWRQMLH